MGDIIIKSVIIFHRADFSRGRHFNVTPVTEQAEAGVYIDDVLSWPCGEATVSFNVVVYSYSMSPVQVFCVTDCNSCRRMT